jgi:hypothetical protein
MHPDAARLFAVGGALRAEADQMLADSGIGVILTVLEHGVRALVSFRRWWEERIREG